MTPKGKKTFDLRRRRGRKLSTLDASSLLENALFEEIFNNLRASLLLNENIDFLVSLFFAIKPHVLKIQNQTILPACSRSIKTKFV